RALIRLSASSSALLSPVFQAKRGGPAERDHPKSTGQLLDFDFGARFFELLLRRIGISLVGTLEQRLGSAFHQGFGFRQTEAGLDFTNSLDDCNLLVRGNRGEDHVKRVLGSSGRSGATSGRSTSGRNRDRRGGRYAPLGFQFFHEVSDFDDRRIAQLFHYICFV